MIGKILINAIRIPARNTLNNRFRIAALLPFLFAVRLASRFGVTEPIAAPITAELFFFNGYFSGFCYSGAAQL